MRSMLYDPDEYIDMFVVQMVVREGVNIRLNKKERVLAAQLCKRKGLTGPETAERMRISEDMVGKYWRVPPPFPIDYVSDAVVGAKVVPYVGYTAGLPKRRNQVADRRRRREEEKVSA